MGGTPIDKDLKSGGHVQLFYGTLYIKDEEGDSVRLGIEQVKELLPCLEAMIALDKATS